MGASVSYCKKKRPGATTPAVVTRLEMEDHVGRELNRVVPSADGAGVGVGIERGGVKGVPVGKLRPELDLRREPMLPTNGELGIAAVRASAGTPAIRVVIIFRPERKVV